ncbi:hypothetical protein OA098_01055 [Prochlorococcus sp. AH-736-B04]|nr:hypothetical protein [Prochlorococcus sp. AH-736-B04]
MNEVGGYNLFFSKEENLNKCFLFKNKHFKFALARHSLIFLIKTFNFKRIYLPSYTCKSVSNILKDIHIEIYHYDIGSDFIPKDIKIGENDLLVVNNYFGFFDNNKKFLNFISQFKYHQILIDNTHSLFFKPMFKNNLSMISPRKFLPLTDGGILYDPKKVLNDYFYPHEVDISWNRSNWLFRAFDEGGRNESYEEYLKFRESIQRITYKRMSKMTYSLISHFNLKKIVLSKNKTFHILRQKFGLPKIFNDINFSNSSTPIAFPLEVKDNLAAQSYFKQRKIYTTCFWNTQNSIFLNKFEHHLSTKILFLPLDMDLDIKEIRNGFLLF